MKKWLAVLSVIALLLFLLVAYVLIPSQFTVSSTILLKGNPNSVYRCLAEDAKWEKISGNGAFSDSFEQGKRLFKIKKKLMGGLEMEVREKRATFPGLIKILPLGNDSAGIKWTVNFACGPNPFKKFKFFFIARSLKVTMTNMLDKMKKFLEDEKNIYDINVHITGIKDTLLVAVKTTFKGYPALQNIYNFINTLQDYAATNGARQTGYPMLSIRTEDSINYETLIGLPVNKPLGNSGIILHREMPSTGRMLVTNDIKGGPYTIAKAFTNLENFFEDHKFISPAVPFESIITDRMQEKDTTKWITRIYYPVY